MKKTLLITTILGGLLSASNSYAQTCTPAPDCESLGYTVTDATTCTSKNLKFLACPFDETKGVCTTFDYKQNNCSDLGYTDTADLCPGDYSICPYDTTKVKCILDAAVGDLKFSWQTKNHDGWLLCNGSTFSEMQFPELANVLGETELPNYDDDYIRGASSTSNTDFSTQYYATLPNIKGWAWLVGGSVDEGVFPKRVTGSNTNVYDHERSGGSGMMAQVHFDASNPESLCELDAEGNETTTCIDNPYQNGKEVHPKNQRANVFIYAGKKGMTNFSLSYNCKVGNFAYAGGICSSTLIEGKTPLGVIISLTTNRTGQISYTYIDNIKKSGLTRPSAITSCSDSGMTFATCAIVLNLYSMTLRTDAKNYLGNFSPTDTIWCKEYTTARTYNGGWVQSTGSPIKGYCYSSETVVLY